MARYTCVFLILEIIMIEDIHQIFVNEKERRWRELHNWLKQNGCKQKRIPVCQKNKQIKRRTK